MRKVAIVGGGPAGATCGERLARAGFRVTIFDEHLAWEKPCGGGLTHKAIQAFPFLAENQQPKRIVYTAELIAGNGERARIELERPVFVYSRAVLNGLLLDRAREAGCQVVRARISGMDTSDDCVRLRTNGEMHAADFVVLAAGARNHLLPGTTPLTPQDLELTVGYFVPTAASDDSLLAPQATTRHSNCDALKVKFLPGLEGYLWSFPRADHLSVGICGTMARNTSQKLKHLLHQFMHEEDITLSEVAGPGGSARFFSHVLPSAQPATLRHRPVLGRNWALAGDAAAWVDPLTGEGIYYAMRSGQLLAEALASGAPEQYPERVRGEFAGDLEFASRVARRFYLGEFLGGAFTTRMVQFVKRSRAVRRILTDLFSGAQDYRTLKRRLRGRIGSVFGEIFAGALKDD